MADHWPPHSPDSERAALGACLQDAHLAAELRRDWFYLTDCQQVADALLAMSTAGQTVAPDTLLQKLNSGGVQNAAPLISDLLNACPSPASFPYHAGVLNDFLLRRQMLATAQKWNTEAGDTGGHHEKVVFGNGRGPPPPRQLGVCPTGPREG